MNSPKFNRRLFLTSGASSAAAALAAPLAVANELKGGVDDPWQPRQADAPSPLSNISPLFFTAQEMDFVMAATERLIPQDDLGPGAKSCGVPLFIDHQLAGEYGRAGSWYMQGPWDKGQDTQGYQSRLTPAALYRACIKAIDDHVSSTQKGKRFSELSTDAQDAVLSDLENGKIDIAGGSAKVFFKTLWLNTKEGMFCDPIYGGNKDMAAWKMLGFPGARYNYLEWVERHGERYDQPPVGIRGRPDWNAKS